MEILIIGGTIFLGRHIIKAAMERGHSVTMFNRGMRNPDLFPEVERIKGDRKTDLALLAGRKWDAVIDTCGYVPTVVKSSAEALKGSIDKYVFISTVSVYADFSQGSLDESAATGKLEKETEEVTGESYGPLKALCEDEVKEVYGEKSLIIRPGLIVGPDDPTDRFTYWPVRMEEGGTVLAPDTKLPAQFIDVRDLAEWIIHLTEENKSGVYNAAGPAEALPFNRMIEEINEAAGGKTEVEWVDEKFLLDKEVAPWSDLPLWLPAEMGGMSRVKIDKALRDGLKFRKLRSIVRDTLEWVKNRKDDYYKKDGIQRKAGISREREKELLEKWRSRER